MQISSDNARQDAGRDINSHNTLFAFQDTHHHAHHHHPTQSPTPKAQLRCPLPSPKFVGRKSELGRLKDFFNSPEQGLKRFTLIGMGGCGKSQIASEFTHGYILKEKIYDPSRVFFVDATNLATLEQSYASIAQSNSVGSSPQNALLWLSNIRKPSFVLIDNADNPNLDLTAYIPRSLNVHVLITTRLYDKGRLQASAPDAFIDLEALPREDAEELLVRTAMLQMVSEDVSVLVQELHCFALAVAQAGACIAFLHLTVEEYLQQFRRLGTSLMDGKNDGVNSNTLHGYPKVVHNTWKLSYDQLPEPSKELFNLCAFLHHTGINETLFKKATDALNTYDPSVPFSPAEDAAFAALKKALESCQGENQSFDASAFRRCIAPILSLSLMRCDPITKVLSIHALVLDSLQRLMSDHLPTSLLLMLAVTSDEQDTPFLYRLLPHVDRVKRHLTLMKGPSQPTRCHPDMAMAFSSVYAESEQWGSAESLLRACMEGRTTCLGKTHEHTLQAASLLTCVLKGSGQLAAAEILGRSVLADWTRECGTDHPGTNRASIRLAATLFDMGRYREAEQVQIDVLSRRRHLLGEAHPDTVKAMNNLANTWSALGRYKEAEKMKLDVLSRYKRLLGDDHPNTLSAMNNLAVNWLDLGRYDEAEKMQLDVLSQRRRLLGEDHPDTVMAMHNLAVTWWQLGRCKDAERVQLDVLSRRRRLLSEDHPDMLRTMTNLAFTWSHLGRYEEAEKMQLDVMTRVTRRLLGKDHPDTVSDMTSLAYTCSNLEKWGEVEQLDVEVLARRKRVLGEDHPDTVQSMANLSLSLAHLQRHDEAERLCAEALQRQRHILGENHPATIRSARWLAWISTHREAPGPSELEVPGVKDQ